MAADEPEFAQVTAEDIDDIFVLQERNQPERGGTLSARLPREWLEAAVVVCTLRMPAPHRVRPTRRAEGA